MGLGPVSGAHLASTLSTDWGGGDPAVSSDSKSVTIWDVIQPWWLSSLRRPFFIQ